jgi:RNA polymerase sigma-70 factor (ECF subfamily)
MVASTDIALGASPSRAAARGGRPAAPAPDTREADLLQRLRRQDPAAFESMVRAHGGAMLAVAKRFMREEEEARDVVQEAFLQAFRAVTGFRGDSRLSTWLHRITVTTALMKLRNRRRRQEESLDDLLPCFADDGHFAQPCTPWEDDASEALERKQTRTLVRECIERLPGSHREILMLRDIEDLDTSETAALLGISENAVKVRLHRARQALRTLLDQRIR